MSVLSAEGLCVTLGGRTVLAGVDLRFEPLALTVVVGANGAGKSTLLAALSGLRRPDQGRVSLGDRDLAALSDRERARRLGVLPQHQEIAWSLDVETLASLGRTARQGAFGQSQEDRDAVARALDAVGLTAFAQRDVATLSGGERSRALLARVFAGDPEWILADEPLTGLDPRHQLETLALLRRFADRGPGGVVVTLHDLALAARVADRVIVLHGGRVLADGAPEAALTPSTLRTAYGVDTRWSAGAAGPLIEILGINA